MNTRTWLDVVIPDDIHKATEEELPGIVEKAIRDTVNSSDFKIRIDRTIRDGTGNIIDVSFTYKHAQPKPQVVKKPSAWNRFMPW